LKNNIKKYNIITTNKLQLLFFIPIQEKRKGVGGLVLYRYLNLRDIVKILTNGEEVIVDNYYYTFSHLICPFHGQI